MADIQCGAIEVRIRINAGGASGMPLLVRIARGSPCARSQASPRCSVCTHRIASKKQRHRPSDDRGDHLPGDRLTEESPLSQFTIREHPELPARGRSVGNRERADVGLTTEVCRERRSHWLHRVLEDLTELRKATYPAGDQPIQGHHAR